ncbi:MAG: hypothetical protein U5L75_00875 [Candidatus Campbellbacteria bacterium]|nr:hypothetical protein [Candidatus Campbellbacteria bacterium]
MHIKKVHNGEAILNCLGPRIYYGSTSKAGVFPPVGQTYRQFCFAPDSGTSGILAFRELHREPSDTEFVQFWWNDDKLWVERGIPRHVRNFSQGGFEESFGLMITHRSGHYVTNEPPEGLPEDTLLVDLLTLLKYIEGSIEFEELYKNSRHVKRRREREEQEISYLRETMLELESDNFKAGNALADALRELEKNPLLKLVGRNLCKKLSDILQKLRTYTITWRLPLEHLEKLKCDDVVSELRTEQAVQHVLSEYTLEELKNVSHAELVEQLNEEIGRVNPGIKVTGIDIDVEK